MKIFQITDTLLTPRNFRVSEHREVSKCSQLNEENILTFLLSETKKKTNL